MPELPEVETIRRQLEPAVVGRTIVNNISRGHVKGDIGLIAGLPIAAADHNLVSDTNSHAWAAPLGPSSLVNVDPLFADEILVIDTAFPTGLTVAEKLQFIRDQVEAKLGLDVGSPAIDAGVVWPGVTPGFHGTAPDMGAIESP